MIPLHIEEAHGRSRVDQPVRLGIPLPRGMLPPGAATRLEDRDGRSLPHDLRTLGAWPDRSAKWVLIDFCVSIDAGATVALSLSPVDTADAGCAESSPAAVREYDAWRIDTGPLRCRVPARGQSLICGFEGIGEQMLDGLGMQIVLTDERMRRHVGEVQQVACVQDGALRPTLAASGHFPSCKGAEALSFTAELSFFRGSRTAMIEVDLWNSRAALHPGNCWDLGDRGSFIFEDLSLRVSFASPAASVRWNAESGADQQSAAAECWSLYQDSSGGDRWDSRNHVDAAGELTVGFRGYRVTGGPDAALLGEGSRADPLVRVDSDAGWVATTMDAFWQSFPKAIRCDREALSIGLFPGECRAPFELQGGERKRHVAFIEIGRTDDACTLLDRRQPLNAWVDPGWIESSGAVPYFTAQERRPANAACFDYVSSIVDGPQSFTALREVIDEYGWRHFGELYADHEAVGSDPDAPLISHYNNQYDFVFAAAFHHLRSRDRRWWELMVAAARHHTDIDIYHTDQDRPAYNGGLFWHTDHYKDAVTATHRTYSRANAAGGAYGGGPSNEHNYTTGLLHYYFLSGDRSAREAVLKLADWVIAMDDGTRTVLSVLDAGSTGKSSSTASPDYHRSGRGAGNSINALLDAYEASGDRAYMRKAEELILRCIHPHDDVAALGLDDPESRWSYLVFLQVLGKYLKAKSGFGERDYYFYYARDSLVRYAQWMLANEVPYRDVLDKVDMPTETWPAQDIRKCHVLHLAADCAGGDESERFRERAKFFYRRCLTDLLSFDTAYLTRPRVILAAYGHVQDYFERYDRSGEEAGRFAEGHGYEFGEPHEFVPQRARIKAGLRNRARLFSSELRHFLVGRNLVWRPRPKRRIGAGE